MKTARLSLACLFVSFAFGLQSAGGEDAVPPAASERAREAKDLFEKGDYRAAEKVYAELADKFPGNVKILSNLGVVRFRAGKLKLAEEALRQALAGAPDDSFLHSTLGIVHYTQGRLDEALAELNKALALDPANAAARDYLSLVAPGKNWLEATPLKLEAAPATRRMNQRELPSFLKRTEAKERSRFPDGDFLTPLERSRLRLPKLEF